MYDQVIHLLCMHPTERRKDELVKIGYFLGHIQFFEQFNIRQRIKVAQYLQIRDIPYGRSRIFDQGDKANEFFVVLRGSCEVAIRGKNGVMNSLAQIYMGGSFGELGLRTSQEGVRAAAVFTIEPSELLYITKKNYNNCLAKYRDRMADSTYSFLKKVPGFAEISEKKLRDLSYVLNFYKVPGGSYIWKEGDPVVASHFLPLIRRGEARAVKVINVPPRRKKEAVMAEALADLAPHFPASRKVSASGGRFHLNSGSSQRSLLGSQRPIWFVPSRPVRKSILSRGSIFKQREAGDMSKRSSFINNDAESSQNKVSAEENKNWMYKAEIGLRKVSCNDWFIEESLIRMISNVHSGKLQKKSDRIHHTSLQTSVFCEIGWLSSFQFLMTIDIKSSEFDIFKSRALPCPTESVLRDFYIDSVIWNEYKSTLIHDIEQKKPSKGEILELNFPAKTELTDFNDKYTKQVGECTLMKLNVEEIASKLPPPAHQVFDISDGSMSRFSDLKSEIRAAEFTKAMVSKKASKKGYGKDFQYIL